MTNGTYTVHRSCEYYAKAVVHLHLNLENMNNEHRFKEKLLVLSHT